MMKRLFSIAVLSLIACALLLSTNSTPTQTTLASGYGSAQKHIEVRSLIATGMPISIIATAKQADRSTQSVLKFSITNQTGKQLDSLFASLFIIDTAGNLVAGEGWNQTIELSGRSSKDFTVNLHNRLTPGDRAILVVHEVVAKAKSWRVETNDLVSSVKAYDSTGLNSLPPAESTKSEITIQEDHNWCAEGIAAAKDVCGDGNVKSFSCNATGYSFTCGELEVS